MLLPTRLAQRSPLWLPILALVAFASTSTFVVPTFAKGPRIGDQAPDVRLKGVDEKAISLARFRDAETIVIVFTCRHCPVSSSYTTRLNALAKQFKQHKVKVLAVNASDRPTDAKRHAKRFAFTYAIDPSGSAARAFGARMTPEVFVLDQQRRIVYRGAIDNSQRRPTKHYVRDAIQATLDNRPIKIARTDPFGCSLRLLAVESADSGEE